MRKLLVLRPCKTKGVYRLGLYSDDFCEIENLDSVRELFIELDSEVIDLKRSLNTYKNHGSLSSSAIATWIKRNNAESSDNHFLFELRILGSQHRLRYLGNERQIIKLFVDRW